MTNGTHKPVLFVDVDGVISLFGFAPGGTFPGAFHSVDGILHCIATDCGERLRRLDEHFELVWATGWEEKANEYLPLILELPFKELPSLTFGGDAVFGSAHWKLGAIDAYAGNRPAAWIDDNLDEQCRAWADDRDAPTLLVQTEPVTGMSDAHVDELMAWAEKVSEA